MMKNACLDIGQYVYYDLLFQGSDVKNSETDLIFLSNQVVFLSDQKFLKTSLKYPKIT